MKFILEFNDKAKSGIKKSFFDSVFKKTLIQIKKDMPKKKIILSLAIVSEEEIKKINKIYRQKNMATDVLSFAEYKNQKELKKVGDKNLFLGEIILCYNDIVKYAEKKKKNPRAELAETASHGLLHLLGFRHSQKMFKIQKTIWKD